MRGHQLGAILAHILAQQFAMAGTICDELFRLGINHVEVESAKRGYIARKVPPFELLASEWSTINLGGRYTDPQQFRT
jgi:hypothetical protein